MSEYYNFARSRPRVTLLVESMQRRWVPVTFLLDSGSDLSIINMETARMLGINHECTTKSSIMIAGTGGNVSNYCLHDMNIRIGSSRPFPVKVAVGRVLDNLLGRHGVFDRFAVTFKAGKVTFQPEAVQSLSSTTRCCGVI